MNIHIPHSWLLDYIETSAKPQEVAKALSLHAFSVERIIKWADGNTIYEIEITPNRGDALSVQGIAREVNAALPRLGIKSTWVENTAPLALSTRRVDRKHKLSLSVEIKNKTLVPRFSAIVLDTVSIQRSPKKIRDRLEKVGIRAINNVVDVTNYFMIDKGQPMHSFDYDKILGAKMVVRESKLGERITTLDRQERKLPNGVIVIEDGQNRLIDLCGIMGAKNSEIDSNTKRVLLFVQIYDPVRIRRASMSLGHRTDAAVRFEKGIDPEGVVPSLWEAVKMLETNAGATVASELIDIVNQPYKAKSISLDMQKIRQLAGVELSDKEIISNLSNLSILLSPNEKTVTVPSWRHLDIETTEDLAEEVIRLYGYYNLPNTPLTGAIPPRRTSKTFYWEKKAREYLKHQGFFESYNTSATTKELAGDRALKLVNPLSRELEYLKTSLIPQLLEVIKSNKGYLETIKVFELASVYLPQKDDLPNQPLKLALATKGVPYLEHRGTLEGLLEELGLETSPTILSILSTRRVDREDILATELDFETLIQKATTQKTFTPVSKFSAVKQDLTLILPQGVSYYEVKKAIRKADAGVEKVVYQGNYQNSITVAVALLDRTKQLDSASATAIRQKILSNLQKNLGVTLKK